MSESESKNEKPKEERRFSQEQYEFLKECSENEKKGNFEEGIKKWNEWRGDDQDVLLESGDFSNWHLKGVNLGTYRQYGCDTPEVYLGRAKFNKAHLEGAQLYFAHMEGAELHETHLEGAQLNFAHFDNTFLLGVHLEGAHLRCAKLKNSNVCNAHLEGADLVDSELEGAKFDNAYLQKSKFQKALISGATSFCYCQVDCETDFRDVGLAGVRIDPGTKQLLEYNIRRMNWEEWYKEHPKLKWLVRTFWWMSDYGLSTGRIIFTFFGLALIFANIYYYWGRIAPPGFVSYLFVDKSGVAVSWWLIPLRALYFSIVTMTTLGFGDMYANAQSVWGHILLSVQVILGYVLLGALVTRFAVLFTASGPAGKFADEKEKKDERE